MTTSESELLDETGKISPDSIPGFKTRALKAEDKTLAKKVSKELQKSISGEVRFDKGSRALYATDLSVYRQVPIGVVIPKTVEDVIKTVEICHRYDVPILGRGCGTSLAGQCCNFAVIIDFSKYLNNILEINKEERYAVVQPGVICDQLRDKAKEEGLTWAAAPATHEYCTMGGIVGNNSCGAETFSFGRTVDNVLELEILTYDGHRMVVGETSEEELKELMEEPGRIGQIYRDLVRLRDEYGDLVRERFPHIPRRVSGYSIDELLPEKKFNVAKALVGSESTCALILSAKVRLVPKAENRTLLVVGYKNVFQAADHVKDISPLGPRKLEGFEERVIRNMVVKGKSIPGKELLPEGHAWVLVEFDGETPEESEEKVRKAKELVLNSDREFCEVKTMTDLEEIQKVWKVRESGVGSSQVPPEETAWPSWEDSAVPPERLGDYLRELDKLITKHDYEYTLFGHFGDGCIHTRITFDLQTHQGLENFKSFMEASSNLVLKYGGSLSGEHGDGQVRANYVHKMFGPELMKGLEEFKRIWDPDGKMNPGKMVKPYPVEMGLRQGPDYAPAPVFTHFKFPEDHGSFHTATERCFGVGKCRRLEGGTMCPSFKVLREEKHTTRGRAHMLFEMLRGDSIEEGWKSEPVKESLDLCLSCKGCKGDCPVSVDIATYKAEFLSHYYEGKRRPLAAYLLGNIYRFARFGSKMPGLSNSLLQNKSLSKIFKKISGIATERTIPPIAGETFKDWFLKREKRNETGERILLWPDTFNNYFRPATAKAAVHVLEEAGFQVDIPKIALCCGRPLYDFGMLEQAKLELRKILAVLRDDIRKGVPLIGLEPSCVAVFKDEMGNLFPDDLDATRLKQNTFLLEDFLVKRDKKLSSNTDEKAVFHAHCHQKAIMEPGSTKKVLEGAGLEVRELETGCCGMAGSFGYEEEKYELSMNIGEQDLFPKIRERESAEIIVTNGFSCRSQIEAIEDKKVYHVVEAMGLGLEIPEEDRTDKYPKLTFLGKLGLLAVTAGVVAGGMLAYQSRRR